MTGVTSKRKALALVTMFVACGAGAVPCTIEPTPAATLLVPYFSLDTSQCGTFQAVTIITVLNISANPALTHVTLWTNMGVPVTGFDLYLQGYDAQSVNVNDVVCAGLVPFTGPTVSPLGSFSAPPIPFSACSDPVASPLGPTEVADLQAYLNGEMSPSAGDCAGWATGVAEGYVTIDVTNMCTSLSPADASYYSGTIAYDNVLVGEYQIIDPVNNFAQGFEAVHIEAYPADFSSGDVTFYGRYNGASADDRREPLGTAYRTPYDISAGVSADTDLIVWRETSGAAAPFSCGSAPAWFPLSTRAVVAFPNQDTAGLGGLPAHASLGIATQRVPLGGQDLRLHPATADRGWMYLNLQHPVSPYSASFRVGQAWVSGIRRSEGRYSIGQHATQLDSACAPGSISFTSPGRTSDDPGPPP